ncbi:MAG: SusD/RagB family nutrient-binding outer membrane lipoprotein [Williamsia sp.]|nr:SusD/RagB family nutrient-binding outer membrane lipoprotein [Williamsia sp.]
MKKYYKSYLKTGLVTACTILLSACEITNLDINTNPNLPATGSLKLLLPAAESAAINAATLVLGDASGFAGQMTSADNYGLDNNSYNGTWDSFYLNMQSVEQMLRATEDGANPYYRGIAMALKAYAVGNMVDAFGDIPYFDAWKGNIAGTDRAVKFDKDATIYEDLLKLCDQAVAEFGKTQAVAVSGDFINNGSATAWTRLTKTIKLRLLLNARKGRSTGNADLKAAFDAGGYITTSSQDFYYQFSTQISPVDNRHPWFRSSYLADNGFTYINHQLMGEMILNKDPRLPLYFYRQATRVLNPSDPTDRGTIPFGGTYLPLRATFLADYKSAIYNNTQDPTADDILYLAGFFGRDRADNTGAAADTPLRTAPGAYPAGGLYSGREITPKALTGGTGAGNGIWPLLMSWNVKFYQVEAILDGTGVTGDARALFESAMREQIASVVKFASAADAKTVAPTAAAITTYVNAWLGLYDAATTSQSKLNVVAKQIWFCTWGQGQEVWNLMRRTGYPLQGQFKPFSTTIQAPLLKPSRQYALRLPYPAQEASLNVNAQKYVSEVVFDRDPVFWDKVSVKWSF